VFAAAFVNYKKGALDKASASDKVYQLLAHDLSGYSDFFYH
jgi:hypothetical protein